MRPKVSVIIPVYNVESWLRQCLDSVANQTLKEIEIICVNDGSSDSSGSILNEYALCDSRFIIIHKRNSGPVSARRAGLDVAKADYISYIDSDDWIEQDMLNNDYNAAIQTDADVLVNKGIYIEDKWNSYISSSTIPAGIYSNDTLRTEVFPKMMRKDNSSVGIIGSLYAKLFKRVLIEKYDPLIDEKMTIHEDWASVYLYLAHAKTVTITENAFYHYRMNHTSSLTKSSRDDHLFNLHLLYNTLKSGFMESDDSLLLINELNMLMGRAIFHSNQYLMGIDGYRYNHGYIFPFQSISKECRLLLYGAGAVGMAYYRQLITTEYCSEIIWVDRNWNAMSAKGFPVMNPEELDKYDFDELVIAVLEEDRAQGIRDYIKEKGVPDEKIIWRNPIITTI
jgi:glycosyltransferase involved in cell wall biosynthesis